MNEPVFSARDGALYGSLGLPLAFLALPLYVVLPNHYAREFGMPLALLGALLLSARLLDAVIDPLETRTWVCLGIEAASQSPATREFNMGVLQT